MPGRFGPEPTNAQKRRVLWMWVGTYVGFAAFALTFA